MRLNLGLTLVALLCPAVALAQSAPSTPAAPVTPAPAPAAVAPSSGSHARGGDITRDEYVSRAVDRAKRSAEARFDRMDTNHDGILTADERRAARQARYHSDSAAEPPTPQPAAAKPPQ